MKKIRLFLLMAICLFTFSANAFAADNVEVYLNGEKKDFTISVSQIDDTVMVPLRSLFELANYKIEWNEMRQRVSTTTAIGKLTFVIGSVLVCQNDYQAYVLTTYPRLQNGTTMIPIKFAADCMDASIQYVESSNSLVINSN